MSESPASEGFEHAAAKVKTFPQTPGVYLMKDVAERVIYIGKAKNLRSRASSYFWTRNCPYGMLRDGSHPRRRLKRRGRRLVSRARAQL